jgi:membrane protein
MPITSAPSPMGLFGAGRRLARAMASHGAFRSAAAVAFWLFLSLVPLLVLLGFLVGQVARRGGVDALSEPLLEIVPVTAEGIVREEVQRLAGSKSSLAPVGALGYLWAASSGVHNLLDVFDVANGQLRPYWKKRAVSLVWVAFGLIAACVVASSLVRIDAALHPYEASRDARTGATAAMARPFERYPKSHPPLSAASQAPQKDRRSRHSSLEQALAAGLTLAVGSVLLACFYRFSIERPAGTRARVWPGTLASVVCWLLVSWGFGVYAASIARYALFYGSLAAVAVLLMWLYLTSICIVGGVEINAMLERQRGDRARPTRSSSRRPTSRGAGVL